MSRNGKEDREARERILTAAKTEFSQKGYRGARMVAIAERAGVNKALIHYYFQSKEKLYQEIIIQTFGLREGPDVSIYIGKWDLTPSQKLYAIIYFMVSIFLKATDPEIFRLVFWELAEGTRYIASAVQEYAKPKQMILYEVISEGIEKGEFETEYPKLSVMSISSFITMYVLHREIHKKTGYLEELYGDVEDDDILKFTAVQIFKSLKPSGKPLKLPELPVDFLVILDEIIQLLMEKQDEGITDSIYKRLEKMLMQ